MPEPASSERSAGGPARKTEADFEREVEQRVQKAMHSS